MKPSRVSRFVLALAGAGCLAGCATKSLWVDQAFNEPAPNPNLSLFQSGPEGSTLVAYDELSERRAGIRRRAYYLEKYDPQTMPARKPPFVDPAKTNGMSPIPVLRPPVAFGLSQSTNLYAVAATNGPTFALCSRGATNSLCELPVYSDGFHRATQIALTPFAVAADALLVASVVGLIFWASSPGQF
jgi:hypothetical protein